MRGRCVALAAPKVRLLLSAPPHSCPTPAVLGRRMKWPLSFSSDKYEATAIIWAEQIGPYGALLSMQGDGVLSERRQRDGPGGL